MLGINVFSNSNNFLFIHKIVIKRKVFYLILNIFMLIAKIKKCCLEFLIKTRNRDVVNFLHNFTQIIANLAIKS